MHGSSSTRIEALTPEQAQLLGEYRDRWTALSVGNAAGDRPAAEAGVRLAYAAAGHAPPASIVWCNGPRELLASWTSDRAGWSAGQNVRASIIDGVRERAGSVLPAVLGFTAITALRDPTRPSIGDTAGRAVADAVRLWARSHRPLLHVRLWDAVLRLARLRNPLSGGPSFARAGSSSHECAWLPTHDFVRDICGLPEEMDVLCGLRLVAANAGWIVPHENVCWLMARPATLSFDAKGRLHGANGPALSYADGWSYYAWKGIEVPRSAIENPAGITIEQIDREPNVIVRRCLIEIMTPGRFVASGGPDSASHDATGILWRKTWWNGDTWAAVEVVDGTPGPDGRRKHYFLQVPPEMHTARAAVAWSYGVSEHQYAALALRT